jgi:hypothetical protein
MTHLRGEIAPTSRLAQPSKHILQKNYIFLPFGFSLKQFIHLDATGMPLRA